MADLILMERKWDVNFSCFFLQKLIDSRILLSEDPAVCANAIEKLLDLSKQFSKQAIISKENYELSQKEEELLEFQWLTILTYERKNFLPCIVTSTSSNITKLKICLVNFGTYIMFKTRRRCSDLDFAVNLLSLTLEGARSCLQDGLIEEADILLKLASNSIRPRMNDETVYDFDTTPSEQLHLKFLFCSSSLFVYRVLHLHKLEQCSEILALLGSTKQEPIEFNTEQADSLSRVCFNIALEIFSRGEFEKAIIWLKFAHSFGKQVMENNIPENCTEDALTLLAACYMQIDLTNYWPQIIEILDYGERTAVNLELRLQALLASGKDSPSIEQSISKYFALKYQESGDQHIMRNAANELFTLLEKQEKHSFLMQLLNNIPWKMNQTCNQPEYKVEWVNIEYIRWICAKFAARYYASKNQTDEFFKLLCEVQQWNDKYVDDSSIYEFMSLAEKTALRLLNDERNLEFGLRWYEIIVQFANRHGIDCTIVWNLMACLLQLPNEQSFEKAKKLTVLIPEYDSWADLDPLCIRLQIALGAQDYDKALEIINDLEAVTQDNDWKKVQEALGRSAFTARENQLIIPMLDYLMKALKKCQTLTMKAILLRLILRFQIEILRIESAKEKKDTILTNIISTIENAYSTTRQAQQNDDLLIDIRIWFARTAWNFARMGNKQSAYFTHHLFKLSSQFFSLESCEKKEAEIAMIKAMEAAFDFGPGRKRIAYVRILQSGLEVVNEYYQSAKESERLPLIRLVEFHALCELKNWEKVEQLFHSYVSRDGGGVRSKGDADFFLGLASIIITNKDAKIHEVVTTERGDDTFQRDKVSAQQQTCLTGLAATSLKIAIDLSTPGGNLLSPKIILCCRWIVGVLFNPYTIRESLTLWQHFSLLDQLVPWLRSSDFPFAEVHWIFNKIWNSVLLCSDRKLKQHVARWLQESFRQSPHYPKLMELFQQQFDLVSPPNQ